jgi:hypothetical protein
MFIILRRTRSGSDGRISNWRTARDHPLDSRGPDRIVIPYQEGRKAGTMQVCFPAFQILLRLLAAVAGLLIVRPADDG